MAKADQLRVGDTTYSIYRLDALQAKWDVARLPYTLRILLENVLRNGTEAEVAAVAGWVATDEPSREISFAPARVLLQDFTGVPCVVFGPGDIARAHTCDEWVPLDEVAAAAEILYRLACMD